jgi:hypothetical protein
MDSRHHTKLLKIYLLLKKKLVTTSQERQMKKMSNEKHLENLILSFQFSFEIYG